MKLPLKMPLKMAWISATCASVLPILATMLLPVAAGAQAIQFYDNTSNELPNRYNPQDADVIVFDDVPIPRASLQLNGQVPQAIWLESITFGLRRTGLAPSTRISAYAAGFANDFLLPTTPIDVGSLQLLDEQILPEVPPGGPLTQAVTFGFLPQFARRVPLVYRGDYGYFAAGLAFGASSQGTAWRLMESSTPAPPSSCNPGSGSGPANLGCYWQVNRLGGPQGSFSSFDTGNGAIAAAFYLAVQGRPDFTTAVAPVPAPLPLSGLVAALGAARRIRRRRP